MKKVAFFLSAQDVDRKYADPALELIQLAVKFGYHFVYGGSNWGLMKEAADAVTALKGHITAISAEEFKHVLREGCDESFIAKNIPERKQFFMEKSDAIVALPGGAGTLDEITDVIAARKLDLIKSPVAFLNTDHFWDGLIMQYKRMCEDKFILKDVHELFFASDDPKKIMKYLNQELKK